MSNILEVKNVKKYFPIRKGLLMREAGQVMAVDDVSFNIRKGETLGLVGESGCGKSTLGRTLIRLYEPTSGQIHFQGKDWCQVKGEELRRMRKNMQMIFQDPYSSLDPRMTVGQILSEPFQIHNLLEPAERKLRARQLLETVGMKASHLNRYPHEFSGGQKQRICIARALALEPSLIIADEPVSALDVSIQAQILNLMKDLQEKFNLTYLFISHDLSVIEHLCDRIAVMYLGKIVEIAPREQLYANPQHPYTQALIAAIPRIGEGKKKMRKSLSGEVPSPINPPPGCPFHPRCPSKMDICAQKLPQLISYDKKVPDHRTACWLYEQHTEKNNGVNP
jgi:oligopeptide transport system ATP-binding protein